MKIIYFFVSIALCLTAISCKKAPANTNTGSNVDSTREGLIAYYPFNNNTNDESGNHYDLLNHGALSASNRFNETNKAFSFDGTSAFMVIPPLIKADSLREYTISVWVKPTSLSHGAIASFIPKTDMQCAGYIGFENHTTSFSTYHQMPFSFAGYTCTSVIIAGQIENPLNKWCHVILMQQYYIENGRPGYRYIQYFNGKQLKGALSGLSLVPEPSSFGKGGIVGGNNNGTYYDFNFYLFEGIIDDVRVYNRVISANEVQKLYTITE